MKIEDLSLLPYKLPGYVERKIAAGSLFINPLIYGIPLDDGTQVEQFFAHQGDGIKKGDYVLFWWKNVGKRGYDFVKKQPGLPQAMEVEVVNQNEAKQIADKIRERLANELRQSLEEQKCQLEREKEKLEETIAELAKKRTEQREKELGYLAEELEKIKQDIEKEFERLANREAELKDLDNEIKKTQEETQAIWKSLEPYRILIPPLVSPSPQKPEPEIFPDDLGNQWNQMLSSTGLIIPEYVANSYLLALLSAFYSGGLILLNGPVGVGKTSIIEKSAILLGGKSQIIPVRPAWIDPSDLLGFFDPLSKTFRPSSFLTALKEAKQHSDRLYLVCLDELNLAKIENYGADLLSSLEYSRNSKQERGLLLYSSDIERELWEEAKSLTLKEGDLLDGEKQRRLSNLQNLLRNYRSNFDIPKNLVLLGTLNADETTYDLSPKVIDRSLVITYPSADLNNLNAFSNLTNDNYKLVAKQLSIAAILGKVDYFYESFNDIFNDISDSYQTVLEKIAHWNKDYLEDLGIKLGYRIKRDLRVFISVCCSLGFSNSNDIIGNFLFLKILPRISFFKDGEKERLCHQWLAEIEESYQRFGDTNIIKNLKQQLDNTRRRNVSYWG